MASWDIGAVQLEGGATDIGAVQAAAAVVTGQPTMRRWGGIPHMMLTGRRAWFWFLVLLSVFWS